MRTWTATTTTAARPEDVLDVLTDPEACARWAPLPFDVEELDGRRLATGSRARVSGSLAGKRVGFDVEVHEASDRGLTLAADGPVGFDVAYVLAEVAGGSEVRASVSVRPSGGFAGRLLAQATAALLSAGCPGSGAGPSGPRSRLLKGLSPLSALLDSPASAYAVTATALTRTYGDGDSAVHALRGVSLDLPAGQFTAVMGPSGSGKSTLMHLLAGLDTPSSGAVSVAGQDITKMKDRELTRLRRKHIGFVFQSFNLLPTLSAEENIVLPLAIAGKRPPAEDIDALLARVGLTERRDHRPAELSGGQQQRVAIARALITRPTVLFADEPTGNLDSEAGAGILRLLRDAVDLDGQTTLMVTHDPRAAAIADRVLYLADGRVVADIADPTEAAVLAVMKEAAAR
jgi:putative ABC transport system ATP-binding protein